jgi:Protein of unknown function (DUF433)
MARTTSSVREILDRGRSISACAAQTALSFKILRSSADSPFSVGRVFLFQALLDYLEAGDTLNQFWEQFPGVSRADAVAALEEAKAFVLARFSK